MGALSYLPHDMRRGLALLAAESGSALMLGLLALNVLTFLVYGWDKLCAKREGARRVPEKTLLLLAVIGGSVGAIAGMYFFRHKTRHAQFRYGLPLILAAQLALLGYNVLA